MLSFLGHQLFESKGGYTLVLYLDPELMELAQGFDSLTKEEDKTFREEIKSYLNNRLPNLKILTVKIMLGSLLIASIPLFKEDSSKIKVKQHTLSEVIISQKNKVAVKNKLSMSNREDLLVVNKNKSLAANYVPLNLVVPDVSFPFSEFQEKKLMTAEAARALESLFIKAKADNLDLYAISGYRSYQRQENIFNAQVEKYGLLKANRVSAKPGESEHQTGLAMDLTSPKVDFKLVREFGTTIEGQWLQENAAQFGFIIRYPAGKEAITGYQYEPWHIRYVGEDIAQEIAENDLTLEEYLS